MNNSEIISRLAAVQSMPGDKERQVEAVYDEAFRSAFSGAEISNPFKCDGYFETTAGEKPVRVICEFKYDMNLASKTERSKVLAQVLFYLKRFESAGQTLPNIVFVGDVNECFCVHANDLIKFLDFEGVDWSDAPSLAYKYGELVAALASDEERNAYVWDVGPGFDFGDVVRQIESFATDVRVRMLHITEHNVDKVFRMFCGKVVKNASKIPPNDLVGLFYGCVCDPENNYLHPAKKNTLVSGAKTFQVDGGAFKAFRSIFEYVKTPSQKKHLAAISDRLIEDTNRRRKGEFYTPTPFVDHAHKFTAARLGEDWKERSVVWDCACGTKNLTRDYRFKELYCSTLEQAELDIGSKYNPEAVSFQFDFLNDPLEKLPEGLKKALAEKREITFLMNPPYGRAGASSGGSGFSGIEAGSAMTEINRQMKTAKIGACSANLFAQFLYRIMTIKKQFGCKVNIALFCNPIFMSGPTFEKFRKDFLKEFKFESGVLFNAGNFSDTESNWGISFNVWSTGELTDKSSFEHEIIEDTDEGIINVGYKIIYNVDSKDNMADWSRELTNGKKTFDSINLTSALNIKTTGNCLGKMTDDAFGYLYSHSNAVGKSQQQVAMFSAAFGNGNGFPITSSNFKRSCVVFAARRLSECDYINFQDQYMKPNTDDPRYPEFEADSLVYSLFESKSQQSSLRKVEYKGKSWDVKNEFFWIPSKTMAEWADAEGLDETYAEASVSPDRHMAKVLNGTSLSAEAKTVLDKATELVRKSMKFRQMFNDDHPEYQVLNFDSSYYQLKPIWKEYMPKEFKIFRELVKKLADKMRPMVYELGFLYK